MALWQWTLVSWLLLGASGVRAAPQFDPNMIIFPSEINKVRELVALEECRRDPTCVVSNSPELKFSCHAGSAAESMLRNVVNLRTGAVGSCNSMLGDVIWPATGQCFKLLTRGPCQPGHWLKLARSSFEPVCEPRPCDESRALVTGACHSFAETSMCPPGQQLFTNEFGEGECDCSPGTVFYKGTGSCYTPYTQGPCRHGFIIRVLDAGSSGHAECVQNPCPAINMVPLDEGCHIHTIRGAGITCFDINTPGPCAEGALQIDNTLNEPVCLETETHSIFNLPNTKRCSLGSIRDLIGRCRRSVVFRPPPVVATSRPGPKPGQDGLCPIGFELLGGTCLKIG